MFTSMRDACNSNRNDVKIVGSSSEQRNKNVVEKMLWWNLF